MSGIGPLLVDGYARNPTTLRLLQLAAGFDDAQAAAFCLVSRETYRRWRTNRPPNRPPYGGSVVEPAGRSPSLEICRSKRAGNHPSRCKHSAAFGSGSETACSVA
jgi:hypothetical protein